MMQRSWLSYGLNITKTNTTRTYNKVVLVETHTVIVIEGEGGKGGTDKQKAKQQN